MCKKFEVLFTVISVICLFLSACGEESNETEDTGEITYRVISGNANSVYPIDENKYLDPIETEFIDVPEGMTNRQGYNNLSDSEKEIYNLILSAMKNCEKKVKVPNIDKTGKLYSKIMELIRCENPAMFHIASRELGDAGIMSQTVEIDFTYKYTPEQVNTMLRKTEIEADKILAKITSEMDEYDIVKLFHDELIINCESDTSGLYSDNVYGALYDKKALCEGYSKAFSYLCTRANIENMIVTGKTGTTDHMWNMVKIEGNWYHVDVTWDYPPDIIKEAYSDAVLYTYFLVSDSVIANGREIDDSFQEIPRATSSVMNYFYHEGLYADNYEDAVNCTATGCKSAVNNGRHSFMIKLASDELYNEVLNGFFSSEGKDTDISRAMSEAEFTGKISCTNMYSSERIIMFMLTY